MEISIGSIRSRVREWLDREPKLFLMLVAILLDILIGILDYMTGYEVHFSLVYLVPVWLVSRGKGKIAGVVVCFISAATHVLANLAAGQEFSKPWIPYWNLLFTFGLFLAVNLSLIAMRRSMEVLKETARTDPLTGVANFRGFRERAQMELDRCLRYEHPITVAYLDVDDLKAINDGFGHSIGDEVLSSIGELISKNIRNTDFVGRLGGDEFAIVFPQTEYGSGQEVANRLKEILSEEMTVRGHKVTVSMGVVTFQGIPSSVNEMIRKADDLMYLAKARGKDTVTFETLAV